MRNKVDEIQFIRDWITNRRNGGSLYGFCRKYQVSMATAKNTYLRINEKTMAAKNVRILKSIPDYHDWEKANLRAAKRTAENAIMLGEFRKKARQFNTKLVLSLKNL